MTVTTDQTVDRIIDQTARYYQIHRSIVVARDRRRPCSYARQTAIYLVRTITGLPFDQIGRYFGGRAHATINYGYSRAKLKIRLDPGYEEEVRAIREMVGRV